LAGCPADDAAIVAVDVVDRSGAASAAGIDEAVRSAIDPCIEALPGFARRSAPDGDVGHQLRVAVELVTERRSPKPGHAHRAVGVTVRLFSLDRALDVEAHGLASGDVPDAAGFDSTADDALAQAFERLAAAIRLRDAQPAAVLDALRSDDDAVRSAAISAAATRELREAVEPLAAMLRSDRVPMSVKLDAVGALVEIGDPAAVGPMIDALDGQPPAFWPQVLFAIAELGGRRAEGFLFTVARGHDAPAVREAAKQALAELERRRSEPASPTP